MLWATNITRSVAVLAALHSTLAATVPPLMHHQVEELADLQRSERLLDRRQTNSPFTVVTGISNTSPQPRLEIRQLQKNTDQWNIYLLGLTRFMQTDEKEKLSYYKVAGIHGRPYVPWDGVQAAPGINEPGYCLHNTQLFLPWHRPYLALFEQTLYNHILAAVNEFPSGSIRRRYSQAALTWRQPYWDWAARPPTGESVLPTSLSSPTVTVTMPNGTNTIPNPLYAFKFHPVTKADFVWDPWSNWQTTLRAPLGGHVSTAVSQDQVIGPILDNSRISFRDRLYNLFTSYSDFSEFGTDSYAFNTPIKNADSLESIHGVLHGLTGSDGHMTFLDYSAYDPIFWLHHTMVDRSFAMWQAINPNSYVQPTKMYSNSFTLQQNQLVDINTPLDPFHSSANGSKWTSATARSIRTFGYTYPELMNNANSSQVVAAVVRLYGSTSGSQGIALNKRFHDDTPPHLWPRDASSNAPPQPPKRREYLANIASENNALGGSYGIYVFLGDFDDRDPECWPTTGNLVGTHAVFAAAPGNTSRPSTHASGLIVAGTMPLTSALLDKAQKGDIKSMNPADVEDYMSKNLQWRVRMFNGTEIPIAQVPGLSVKVVGADITPATKPDQFPRWGNFGEIRHVSDSAGAACAAS